MPALNLVIADDQPLLLLGLEHFLAQQPGICVQAAARSLSELVAALERARPDAVLVDYSMPGDARFADGMAFVSYLRRRFGGIKVLVLGMFSNQVMQSRLYALGVYGVLHKQQELDEIHRALHLLRLNRRYWPPGFVLSGRGRTPHPAPAQRRSLTPREFEVLRLFAQGHTVSAIAQQFKRSIKTISSQKSSAARKLGARSNQELLALCRDQALGVDA